MTSKTIAQGRGREDVYTENKIQYFITPPIVERQVGSIDEPEMETLCTEFDTFEEVRKAVKVRNEPPDGVCETTWEKVKAKVERIEEKYY